MTRPLEWMTAVRDHPERPPARQRHVLDMLALRVDWTTGIGFASVADLCADADVHKATALRALAWARGAPRDEKHFLAQTHRGHRLGNGGQLASVWLLRLPSQPVTPADVLTGDSQGRSSATLRFSRSQDPALKVAEGHSQGRATSPPSRPSTSRPSTSRAGAGPQPLSADGLRSAADQTGAQWGDDRRTGVCRSPGHKKWDCPYPPATGGWCQCPCHERRAAARAQQSAGAAR